ncbi:hypothetical protein SeMB42_g07717 [Synchytrium endobioticum]|uniref:Uncharacterized protein n=1 Tax=Synchytrium endobioticum TaxID=286115 RepID=A0A507BRC4_9FUNG|nr:hypothetical protein SeMB42_g07717 [Synchytrium endobioticum]
MSPPLRSVKLLRVKVAIALVSLLLPLCQPTSTPPGPARDANLERIAMMMAEEADAIAQRVTFVDRTRQLLSVERATQLSSDQSLRELIEKSVPESSPYTLEQFMEFPHNQMAYSYYELARQFHGLVHQKLNDQYLQLLDALQHSYFRHPHGPRNEQEMALRSRLEIVREIMGQHNQLKTAYAGILGITKVNMALPLADAVAYMEHAPPPFGAPVGLPEAVLKQAGMEMAIEGERLRKYVDILEEVEEFHPGGRIRSSVDALKLTSLKYLDLVRATSIPLGVPYTPTQLSDLPRDFMSMLFIDFARKYHKLVRWKLHLVFLEVLQYATDNGLLMSYQWQDRLATFENIIANHVYLYGKYKIYLLEVWERLSADEVDEYRRLLEGELRNTQTANGADKKKLMEYVTPGYMQELLQVNGLPYWFTDVLEQDIVPDVPVNYLEMATVYHQVVVYRTLNILRFLDHVADTHGQGGRT